MIITKTGKPNILHTGEFIGELDFNDWSPVAYDKIYQGNNIWTLNDVDSLVFNSDST